MFKYKSLLLFCFILSTFSKHYLIETDDKAVTNKADTIEENPEENDDEYWDDYGIIEFL